MTNWPDRIGQADADTFNNIMAKLGNNTTAFWTAIGYEGATSLAAKLTAARAALLDQITAARMAELDAANIPADIDTLLTRLTALRAGYLDNLSAGAVALAATALSTAVWTAARAGYLDNINQAGLLSLTAARAGYLDNINNAQLLNITAARLGYIDNLSGGAAALQASLISVGATDFNATAKTSLQVAAAAALAAVA